MTHSFKCFSTLVFSGILFFLIASQANAVKLQRISDYNSDPNKSVAYIDVDNKKVQNGVVVAPSIHTAYNKNNKVVGKAYGFYGYNCQTDDFYISDGAKVYDKNRKLIFTQKHTGLNLFTNLSGAVHPQSDFYIAFCGIAMSSERIKDWKPAKQQGRIVEPPQFDLPDPVEP